MVKTVASLGVQGPFVDVPPFFKPNCRYLFNIKKEKKGDSIMFILTPVLQCDHIAERRQHTVAWVQYDMDIQTDGTITVDEFYIIFERVTELFKSMLALHPEGPRIGPMNISCPPQAIMQDQLQALVDWFHRPGE